MKCRGEIAVREAVEVPEVIAISVHERGRVQPAGQIRRRHPFFVPGKTVQNESLSMLEIMQVVISQAN